MTSGSKLVLGLAAAGVAAGIAALAIKAPRLRGPEVTVAVARSAPPLATPGQASVAPVLRIPAAALRPGPDTGAGSVWVVVDRRVQRREVTLGDRTRDQLEVRAGLEPGDTVVTGPPAVLAALKGGQPVRIAAEPGAQ